MAPSAIPAAVSRGKKSKPKTVTVKGKEYYLLPDPISEAGGRPITLIRVGGVMSSCQLNGYTGRPLKIVGVAKEAQESGGVMITEHTMVAFTLAGSDQPPAIAIKLSCFAGWQSIMRLIKL